MIKRLLAAATMVTVLGVATPAVAAGPVGIDPPTTKNDQLCVTLWLIVPIPICIPLI